MCIPYIPMQTGFGLRKNKKVQFSYEERAEILQKQGLKKTMLPDVCAMCIPYIPKSRAAHKRGKADTARCMGQAIKSLPGVLKDISKNGIGSAFTSILKDQFLGEDNPTCKSKEKVACNKDE